MFVFTFPFFMFEIEIRCDYSFFYLWLLKLQLQFCAKNSLGRPHPFACRQTVGWFPTSRWCGGRNGVRSVIEFTIEFTIDFPHHRIEIVFFFGFLRLFHFALPAAHKNKNKEHWSGTATKQQPPTQPRRTMVRPQNDTVQATGTGRKRVAILSSVLWSPVCATRRRFLCRGLR
mgnify:FL=1